MKNTLLALLAAQLVWGSVFAATKGKIQCWTDEEGNRSCGDHVPPKYAGQEREVMNKRGVMVESRPRARTPEELKVEEEQRKQQAEEQKRADQQRAYDRYLIESYQDVRDLERMRDDRLRTMETRIELLKRTIEANQSQLDKLVADKQYLQKKGKPVEPKLDKQIQEFRRASVDNARSLTQLQFERDKLLAQFDRDIARYNELKTVKLAAPPATP